MSEKQAAKPRQSKFVSKLLSAILSAAGVLVVFAGAGLSSAPAQADPVEQPTLATVVAYTPPAYTWDNPRVVWISGGHDVVVWRGQWYYDRVFVRYVWPTYGVVAWRPVTPSVVPSDCVPGTVGGITVTCTYTYTVVR